jgi:hypothetical protein
METGKFVGFCAVFAIVLGIVLAVAGPGTKFDHAWQYLTSGNTTNQQSASAPTAGSSVVGSPTISAQQIDQILCKYGSPACGTGQDLYSLGVQSNIDPAFALAVFFNESNFGKSGEAVESHSLGNLRCIPDAACVHGYAWFNSWQDSYRAFYALISGPIYAGAGLTTPESILPVYAPSGDNNDPRHYAQVVESAMSLWRGGSTEVPA